MLTVPFAAVMASLSWMTGADLEMDVLDESYVGSLKKARDYFYRWFSKKWSFAGQIKARTEKNEGSAVREGVLYSGGLDALTTYIRHREKKPMLFSFFGADIPLGQPKFADACKRSFHEFAGSEGVELCCIDSDFWDLFAKDDLKQRTLNWWGETAHAMVLSAMTAPFSYREFGRLWMASSHMKDSADYGWGSDYDLDNDLCWGDTYLKEDFHDGSRIRKIQYFKNYPEYHRFLRVCYNWWRRTGEAINCGRCEKCLRTICELMLNGIDPADCNFQMTDATFPELRKALEKPYAYHSFFNGGSSALEFWTEIRRMCLSGGVLDRYGSGKFFKWLVKFDKIEKMKSTALGRAMFRFRRLRWDLMRSFGR